MADLLDEYHSTKATMERLVGHIGEGVRRWGSCAGDTDQGIYEGLEKAQEEFVIYQRCEHGNGGVEGWCPYCIEQQESLKGTTMISRPRRAPSRSYGTEINGVHNIPAKDLPEGWEGLVRLYPGHEPRGSFVKIKDSNFGTEFSGSGRPVDSVVQGVFGAVKTYLSGEVDGEDR